MTVAVKDVVKRFGSERHAAAVDGVSFEAEQGAITTLLGPSGSGKSTLLRVIAGLEEPTSGTVTIEGKDVTRVSPRERNVGFVFQSYALFRHMTVFENVAFGMKIRGASKGEIKTRVEELLSLVQLSGYGSRFPGQLSGGQRQRVARARSLATNPKVLLLDEPFGALDTQVRVELRQWLLGFQERTGVTTILVTHDQEEAFELSSHVVLLSEGKVVQAGSPHELYDHPETAFVASFLGGGNVLRGTVTSGRARLGSLEVRAPEGARDGLHALAIVRRHDVKLEKTSDVNGASVARVERLTRIGAEVKVSLVLPGGDPITVHVTKPEFDALDVQLGDPVIVNVTAAKVFVSDYAI
jgi:sulfate transport system ATP-binding protein